MLDTTRIYPHLHMGSFPPAGLAVARAGFQTLVLTTIEVRPPPGAYPGVELIYAPLDDSEADPGTLRMAGQAAAAAAQRVARGRRVLVCCAQGRNRSGLVVALALHQLTGWSGAECRQAIQARRPAALTNPAFAAYLDRLGRILAPLRTALGGT